MLIWRVSDLPQQPKIQRFIKNSSVSDDFAAAGFWVDDCVVIGSGKELTSFSKSIDAKYGITGPGEVR